VVLCHEVKGAQKREEKTRRNDSIRGAVWTTEGRGGTWRTKEKPERNGKKAKCKGVFFVELFSQVPVGTEGGDG